MNLLILVVPAGVHHPADRADVKEEVAVEEAGDAQQEMRTTRKRAGRSPSRLTTTNCCAVT
jgi:hypothetical protein